MSDLPTPNDRVESLLMAILTGDGSDLPTPRTRTEKLLMAIYENGGTGGGGTEGVTPAQVKTILLANTDGVLNGTSENPIANKAIVAALADYVKSADLNIPTKVSELTNDEKYQTDSDLVTALTPYAKSDDVTAEIIAEIAKVVAGAPESFDTLKEMSDWIEHHENDATAMNSAISDNKNAIDALQTNKANKNEIPNTVAELTDSADYAKTVDIPETLPANGGNADTVNNHNVESDVPVDAKFTDTVYNDTEVKESIEEVNSNLDGLQYNKVAGGKNKFDFGNKYEYEDAYKLIESVSDKSLSMKTRSYGATFVYRNKKFENLGETSISFSSTSTGGTNARLYFKLFDANGNRLTSSNCNFPIGTYNDYYKGWYYEFSSFGDLSITFTMPTNVAFWNLGLGANAESGYTLTFTNIQVEKGSIATPYEPYIPSVKMLAEEVNAQNESLGEYDINENVIGSYSKNNGFAIEWIKMCKATKGTYKLSYTINGSTDNTSEIALGKAIDDKSLYRNSGIISDGIYEQIINITSDTDVYIMAYTNGSITISNIKFTLQNIANEVGNLKNDLVVLEATSTIDMAASRELDDITTVLTIPSGYRPIAMYGYNTDSNDNVSVIPLLLRSDGKVLFHAKNHSTSDQGIIHFAIRVTFKKVS